MKVKLILAITFVLISSLAFSNSKGESKFAVIRGQESGIFKVIFTGQDLVQASISILDKKGNLVFTKNVKGVNGFIQPINFNGLPTGEYTIEVKNNSNTWMHTINYSIETVENSSNRTKEAIPSISHVNVSKLKNDGKYLLSVTGTKTEKIEVQIFDDNRDLLLSKTLMTEGDLAVLFNVKEVSGKLKFKVTDKSGYSVTVTK